MRHWLDERTPGINEGDDGDCWLNSSERLGFLIAAVQGYRGEPHRGAVTRDFWEGGATASIWRSGHAPPADADVRTINYSSRAPGCRGPFVPISRVLLGRRNIVLRGRSLERRLGQWTGRYRGPEWNGGEVRSSDYRPMYFSRGA
jgi:hypothetical protein